jgi:hypothetical protein
MKHILTIILCSMAFVAGAQQFRYGANVAPTVSFWLVEGDNYVADGTKIGFQVGGTIDLTLGESERFALQSGLNFTSAPGAFKDNPEGLASNGKAWDYSITTLDLPLLLRLRSDELGNTVLFAQYGLTLGFTMSEKITVNDGKNGGSSFDYEGVNRSLTMGAGAEVSMDNDMTLVFTGFFMNGTKSMVVNTSNPNNDSRYFPQQIGLRGTLLF